MMNKLLMMIFPLAVMIMLAIINMITAGGSYVGLVDISSPIGHVTVDGASSEATYDISQTQYLGIFSQSDIYIMFTIAIVVAIALGFSAFGSGMSTLSQELTLKSTVFGGIWGLLSVSTWEFFDNVNLKGLGVMIWGILTISYVIGFVSSIKSSGE